MVQANVKSEPMEDAADVEPMEPDPVATNDMEDNVKAEPEGGDEDSGDNRKSVPCTTEQLEQVAQRLGASWKTLAPKLGFTSEEVRRMFIYLFLYSAEADLVITA